MKKLITVLLTTTLISACGWHLRGTMDMPAGVEAIYVTAEDSHGTLITELKRTLVANQITATSEAGNAQYSIILSNQTEERRAVSVGNDALAAEYELTMEVDYRIENSAGALLLPTATARAFRSYDFERDAVIAKDEEERLIKQEMRSTLVQQILRRLRFLSEAPAAATPTATDPTVTTPETTVPETNLPTTTATDGQAAS